VIETLPVATPQNEFVSDALEQSTEFVVTAAGTEATAYPGGRSPGRHRWTGVRRVARRLRSSMSRRRIVGRHP